MTDIPWPKALESWEPELRLFSRELVGQLATLSERIAHAVGPLRISTEQRSDEPNGYSALSRRGPYDRLLVSEWALQLEHEDEFIRRASSGEHLFVELERRSPAISLEAWLLLDTGPAQLGSPRIAHLAALVAFTRRARNAGIALHWAPVWNWERPAHEQLTPATLQAWFAARTPYEPTEHVLTQWAGQWPEREDVERDVWLVGGPDSMKLARDRGWSSLVVDDAQGDGTTSLELRVTPAKKLRTTTLQLALPEPDAQVRLLRDPFDWNRPRPAPAPPRPRGNPQPIPLAPNTELAFSHDCHRLLARTEAGSVVAIPIRNTPRAGYGWPTVATLPPQTNLVASVWGSRRARALAVELPGGAVHLSDWDGRLGVRLAPSAPRPAPHELFTASWPMNGGWEMRGTWFDANNAGTVDPELLFARAFGSSVGKVIEGWRLDARYAQNIRTLSVPVRPARVWLSWEVSLAAACLHGDRVDVHTLKGADVQTRSLPRALFAAHVIHGVIAGPKAGEATLLALRDDRRSLHSLPVGEVAPQWREEIRARAPIESFAMSAGGRFVAWRDLDGEVAIYSRERGEVVLRVHTKNISTERP
jgi:hypothetical protein